MTARLPLLVLLATVASIFLGGAAVGCGRGGAKLRDAASADLNCPPGNLHIIGASRTKDVNGCGHQATYKYEGGEWYMTMRDGQAYSTSAPTPRSGPPAVAPAQSATPTSQISQPASTVTGTPSMPPSSPPPPAPPAQGSKSL